MKASRLAALAAANCAAVLSVAACAAGVTTASPVRSTSPAVSPAASSAGAATRPAAHPVAPPAGSVRTVTVDAPIGSFPIPAGAKVVENVTYKDQIAIIMGSVSPAEVSRFYLSALPRAGFKITSNTQISVGGTGATGPESEFAFTGHGYKGTIGAITSASIPRSVNLGTGKNLVAINLTPRK